METLDERGRAVIESEVPYKDDKGETQFIRFVKPAEFSVILPQEHLYELIERRKERPPYRNDYAYQWYDKNQKWRYFLMGAVAGAVAMILLTIVKTFA